MKPSNSSTDLVIGAAVFGLAPVAVGVRWYRRRQVRVAASRSADEMEKAAEPIQEGHSPDGPAAQSLPPASTPEKLPLDYFVLVTAISIPIWLVGGNKLPLPVDLPVSSLAVFCPAIAASILTYKRRGLSGVKGLFRRAFDLRVVKNKLWLGVSLLLLPAIYLTSYALMRLTGQPLPEPEVPLLMAPAFFLMFFLPAMGEELGWMGYAVDPIQKRYGALKAGLILGVVWALWHVIPDIQNQKAADWILWHRLYSVALRVLIVWIYNNTGKSVFAAILVHTMDNVSVFLFPNYGSHYNPFITGSLAWLAAGAAILVWGPQTLARYRAARAGQAP